MPQGLAETISLALLAAVLAFAITRPRGLPEAVVAVPAAGVALAIGLVPHAAAIHQATELAPTLLFLAAILLLGHLAHTEGVFGWLGSVLHRAGDGRPRRLLLLTFAAAAGTTAVLSLDATVLLLTPVVLVTAGLSRLSPEPHAYACAHMANSASTLLPVSNLTNLLVFALSGLSFLQFTALMALPWLVVVAAELALFLAFFAGRLTGEAAGPGWTGGQPQPPRRRPTFALAVLAAVLLGFATSSATHVEPAWIAAAGAGVLALRGLRRGTVRKRALLIEAAPLFAVFVLALAVVVAAVAEHGLGDALHWLLPTQPTLPGLLGAAALAALAANLVNNLPATLILTPAFGAHPHPGVVLAVLLGLNIGPNASYAGSLATLLWRRVLRGNGVPLRIGEFTWLGLLTVPTCLVLGVLALWLGLAIGGLA